MPDATLNDLLTELRAIRTALETRPAAPPFPVQRAMTASAPTATKPGDVVIPQPTTIIDSAGEILIHFGKNSGTPLKALTERSLSWYAEEHPPQLKNDGTPFDPRPADTLLKNAARTYWHETHGTLVGRPATPSAPRAETPQIPYRAPAVKSQTEKELDGDPVDNCPF
jgi:hypothetical protein